MSEDDSTKTTGGYTPPLDSFKNIVLNNSKNGVATTQWTCRNCDKQISIPTKDYQDLVCPECGYAVPIRKSNLEETIGMLIPRNRSKFFCMVEKAMNWRGWDRNCHCHACNSIRHVAQLMLDNGYEFSEYT